MGKTQSKPLAVRHGRGTAWERHGMCELAFNGRSEVHRAVLLEIQVFWDVISCVIGRVALDVAKH
jgi:hypothetical protein